MANQQALNLISSTMETFNGDTTSISTIDGISLIDHWLTALRSGDSDERINPISQTLSELKMQLLGNNPDSGQIKVILNDLADQTGKVAESADDKTKLQLNELAETLRDFGRTVNGEGGSMEEKHGRGQLFTKTGTGSAAGNPGVNPAVPGNAGTGDEGKIPSGGAYQSGSGNGSSAEPATSNSAPDTRPARTSTGEGGGNSHQI